MKYNWHSSSQGQKNDIENYKVLQFFEGGKLNFWMKNFCLKIKHAN